jgi:hypothetical protein
VTGTGTLPEGIPNGLDLQLLVRMGIGSYGVLGENLFAPSNTCGRNVTYTIRQLSAGTFTLEFNVYDPESDELDTLFEGSATEPFSIADGETLRFDATFRHGVP